MGDFPFYNVPDPIIGGTSPGGSGQYGGATLTQFQALQNQVAALDAASEKIANRGQPSGYATLDSTAHLSSAQLPNTVELVARKDQPGGYPSLDGTGKVPASEVNAVGGGAIDGGSP